MIMNDEVGRMYNEAVLVCLMRVAHHLLKGTEERDRIQLKHVETQTCGFLHTKQ
jgi:hypothetical protein